MRTRLALSVLCLFLLVGPPLSAHASDGSTHRASIPVSLQVGPGQMQVHLSPGAGVTRHGAVTSSNS